MNGILERGEQQQFEDSLSQWWDKTLELELVDTVIKSYRSQGVVDIKDIRTVCSLTIAETEKLLTGNERYYSEKAIPLFFKQPKLYELANTKTKEFVRDKLFSGIINDFIAANDVSSSPNDRAISEAQYQSNLEFNLQALEKIGYHEVEIIIGDGEPETEKPTSDEAVKKDLSQTLVEVEEKPTQKATLHTVRRIDEIKISARRIKDGAKETFNNLNTPHKIAAAGIAVLTLAPVIQQAARVVRPDSKIGIEAAKPFDKERPETVLSVQKVSKVSEVLNNAKDLLDFAEKSEKIKKEKIEKTREKLDRISQLDENPKEVKSILAQKISVAQAAIIPDVSKQLFQDIELSEADRAQVRAITELATDPVLQRAAELAAASKLAEEMGQAAVQSALTDIQPQSAVVMSLGLEDSADPEALTPEILAAKNMPKQAQVFGKFALAVQKVLEKGEMNGVKLTPEQILVLQQQADAVMENAKSLDGKPKGVGDGPKRDDIKEGLFNGDNSVLEAQQDALANSVGIVGDAMINPTPTTPPSPPAEAAVAPPAEVPAPVQPEVPAAPPSEQPAPVPEQPTSPSVEKTVKKPDNNVGYDSIVKLAVKEMKAMNADDKETNWDNIATAFEFFIDKGLTAKQAAGIIGNLRRESFMNPQQKQFNGGPGRGIAQWTEKERWATLEQFAKRNGFDKWKLNTQLLFIWHEMTNGGEGLALKELRKTNTVAEATVAFEKYYERAGVEAHKERIDMANDVAEVFNDVKEEIKEEMPQENNNTEQNKEEEQENKEDDSDDENDDKEEKNENRGRSGSEIKEQLENKYNGESGRLGGDELDKLGERYGDHKLYKDAVEGFRNMAEAFEKDMGKPLELTDSYRDYEAQVQCREDKGSLCAMPGTSNHGWGMAIDFASGINDFDSKEHKWMKENAPKFGWSHPDWAQRNGSKPEPWHWEYTGKGGELN